MRLRRVDLAFLVLAASAAPALAGCGSLYDELYKPLEDTGGTGATTGTAAGAAGGTGGSTGGSFVGGSGGSIGGSGGSIGGSGGSIGGSGGSTGGTGPVCGDGNVEDPEQCDDQNETEGDGCYGCQLDCGCPGCQAGAPCVDCPVAGQISYKDPNTKHCYQYVPDLVAWADAEAACVAWGGHGAAPSTAEELANLVNPAVLPPFADTALRSWIGGNDMAVEGTFVWTNGETWLDPASGGPGWIGGIGPDGGTLENCVAMGYEPAIRDRDCALLFSYVCERGP